MLSTRSTGIVFPFFCGGGGGAATAALLAALVQHRCHAPAAAPLRCSYGQAQVQKPQVAPLPRFARLLDYCALVLRQTKQLKLASVSTAASSVFPVVGLEPQRAFID